MTAPAERRLCCDWAGCRDYVTEQAFRPFHERPAFTMTATEIRRKARRSGWRAMNENGQRRDYCPRHATLAADRDRAGTPSPATNETEVGE